MRLENNSAQITLSAENRDFVQTRVNSTVVPVQSADINGPAQPSQP
jgi:hypothetical protein